jgi:hypothetical protein
MKRKKKRVKKDSFSLRHAVICFLALMAYLAMGYAGHYLVAGVCAVIYLYTLMYPFYMSGNEATG